MTVLENFGISCQIAACFCLLFCLQYLSNNYVTCYSNGVFKLNGHALKVNKTVFGKAVLKWYLGDV